MGALRRSRGAVRTGRDGTWIERPLIRGTDRRIIVDTTPTGIEEQRLLAVLPAHRLQHLTVVDTGVALRSDLVADFGALLGRVDVAILALPPDPEDAARALALLKSALAAAPIAPVMAFGVVEDPDGASVESLRLMPESSVIGEIWSMPRDLDLLYDSVDRLTRDRSEYIRASAAMGLLDAALVLCRDPGESARVESFVRDWSERTRLAMPSIEEVSLVRRLIGGRFNLPKSYRTDLIRVLLEADVTTRLGLDASAPIEAQRHAAETGAKRWRTYVNTGRAPFSAVHAAETVAQCYEQLWAGLRDVG